jgi:hypothetical protein
MAEQPFPRQQLDQLNQRLAALNKSLLIARIELVNSFVLPYTLRDPKIDAATRVKMVYESRPALHHFLPRLMEVQATAAATAIEMKSIGEKIGRAVPSATFSVATASVPELSQCYLTVANARVERALTHVQPDKSIAVPAGRYDLYCVWAGVPPIRWARGLTLKAGDATTVAVASGIQLNEAPILPPPDGSGWWGVTATRQPANKRLTWNPSPGVLAVPPGVYDVYWTQRSDCAPMCWARGVNVVENQLARVAVDSGVVVQLDASLPALGDWGWWGLSVAGQPAAQRVTWTHDLKALAVPPGEYDVYWTQDSEHNGNPLLLQKSLKIDAGRVAHLKLDSGLRLSVGDGLPPIGDWGWWGVARAGDQRGNRVHWTRPPGALLLPAGLYDLYWVQDADHASAPLPWARGVEIRCGQVVQLSIDSGIRVEQSAKLPPIGSWGWWAIVKAGDSPQRRLHWAQTPGVLPCPKGDYDIYWAQDGDHQSAPIKWAAGIAVTPGTVTSVTVDSGIELEHTIQLKPLGSWGWWGAAPAGTTPERRVNWAKEPGAIALPPGTYDVYWASEGSQPNIVAAAVEVRAGTIATVNPASRD